MPLWTISYQYPLSPEARPGTMPAFYPVAGVFESVEEAVRQAKLDAAGYFDFAVSFEVQDETAKTVARRVLVNGVWMTPDAQGS